MLNAVTREGRHANPSTPLDPDSEVPGVAPDERPDTPRRRAPVAWEAAFGVLSSGEAAITNAAIDRAVADVIASTNMAATLRTDGRPAVFADERGRIVGHDPEGTVAHLA